MKVRALLVSACVLSLLALFLFACDKDTPTDACADGHTESDWILLLAPTGDAEGKRHKICTVCGATLAVETLPPLDPCAGGHTPGEWETDGTNRQKRCLVCGEVLETEAIAPADQADPVPSRAATDPIAPDPPGTGNAPDTDNPPNTENTPPEAPALLAFTLLENGACAVRAGAAAAAAAEITIPATYGEARVTEIAPHGFADCAALKRLSLPEGVTRIGEGAFAGCAALERIDLPSSLISVGARAFADCPRLPVSEQGNGRYLAADLSPAFLLLSLPHPDVDYFAPAAGTRLVADDAFAASPALASLLLPTSLCAVGPGLAAHENLCEIYTDLTAAEWAALPGAAQLPARVAVYTRDTWGFIHGRPAAY